MRGSFSHSQKPFLIYGAECEVLKPYNAFENVAMEHNWFLNHTFLYLKNGFKMQAFFLK